MIKDGTTGLLVTGPNSDGIQQMVLLTYHCISSAGILANATCKIDVKATTEDVLAGKNIPGALTSSGVLISSQDMKNETRISCQRLPGIRTKHTEK